MKQLSKQIQRHAGALLSLTLLCSAGLGAHAQAVYGSIIGTVTDASGAAIPNATVVVTDEGKGTSITVQSNGSGDFTAEHLIPDTYTVKVDSTGFKSFQTTGVRVSADTSVKIPATLTIGGAGETVTVTSDSVPQLKTDRADVATVFGAKEIQDLPIGDRNFTNLQLLLPGAQALGWSHAASENPQGSRQIQVDGQAFGGVAFQLDGTDNQDPILGIIVINPNIESLSESKITTQNFDAEFGKAVSSVVTAQTKSGSNNFHGSLFDYRTSAANLARDPFTQTAANGVPSALKNLFGASIGGPILKDKLFFFGDYQGVRQKVGTSNLQTVPTPHLIASCLGQAAPFTPGAPAGCDFTEYVNASTPSPIYQAGPGGTRVQYAGNVIPTAQLSPQALALFKLLQPYAPNRTNGSVTYNGVGLNNNYASNGTGGFNSNQWDVRGDYTQNERLHYFGRFSRFTDTLTGATAFGPAGGAGFGIGSYGGNSSGANDSVALGVDIAINPTLVADVRLGYYRYNIKNQKYDAGVNFAQQLGIPGENLGDATTSGAPLFNITEVGSFGGPGNGAGLGPQYGGGLNVTRCNCPLTEREDQGQIVSNITKTLGNHNVKLGVDIRYARNLRVPSDNDRTGNNLFGTGPTSNGSTGTGLGFATFVLGDVSQYNRYVGAPGETNAKEFQKRDFFYVQDTWRATPKLTLNYGLRYEIYFPESINIAGDGGLLNLGTGFIQVAGVGGIGSNMNYSPAPNAYNPRVGIAYQATDKTVIRGGYGRSFDLGVFGSIFGHVSTQNLPVLANQSLGNFGANSTNVAFNLANGPAPATPASITGFAVQPPNGLLANPGYAVTTKSRPNDLRLPTLDAWNLSVQQSVTPTLSFTLAYVANKGTHTLSAGDGNNTNPNEPGLFLPAQYSITGQALHYDPLAPATPTAGGATSNSQYLQRYYGGKLASCASTTYQTQLQAAGINVPAGSCGWTQGISYYGDDQDTHYSALQATLTKTFAHGLSFNANYAWQRGINFNSGYATWDRQAVKGRDDSIRPQQIVVYGLAELPFGHNKAFLANSNRVVNAIVSGIQISPVINYSSGLPFTLSPSNCPQTSGTSAPCYFNGDSKAFHPHITGYAGNGLSFYDASVVSKFFTVPGGLDQIGNVGRNSVYGPHYFNADIALQKDFTIREKLTAQLRVDGFNAFNHINFGNPGGNVLNGSSSGNITAGPGIAGYTNPRQLQFSGRFQF